MATTFLSIGTYLTVAIVLYLQAEKISFYNTNAKLNPSNTPKKQIYVWFLFITFALFTGLRFRVGADCESYTHMLKDITGDLNNYHGKIEPLFYILTKAFADLGLGRVAYLSFIALLQIVFLYKALQNRLYLFKSFILVTMLGPLWVVYLTNGLRQQIVACILLYALSIVSDKNRNWTYLLLITTCIFVHKSAIILYPLLLVKYIKRIPSVIISLGLILICVAIGQTTFVDNYLLKAKLILDYLGYDSYGQMLDYYVNAESSVISYGPRRIVQLLTYVLIIIFSKKMELYFKNDKLYKTSFILFLIYACISEALFSKSLLFIRPFEYFVIEVAVCGSYLLYYLSKEARKNIIYPLSICITCSYLFIACIAVKNDTDEIVNYKTVLFHNPN